MAFVPLPNTIQANMRFTLDGEAVENVFHYTVSPAFDLDFATAADELGGELVAAWNTNMKAKVNDEMILTEVYLTDQEVQNGEALVYTTGLPLTGTVTAQDMLPANCAIVVTKLTAARGRSFRGRTYLCGYSENNQASSRWEGVYLTDALTYMESIREPAGATYSFFMAVASRFSEGAPRVTGVLTPVTSFRADAVVASQRRRLPGRGQ
jgi:hypothetical protein